MKARTQTFPDRESAAAETFVEVVETIHYPDMSQDSPMEFIEETRHALYQLKLNGEGVSRQLIATAHGRFIGYEMTEEGEKLMVFKGLARDGTPFQFELREKDYQNSRAIQKAFSEAAGPANFITKGKARAMIRAFVALCSEP